MTPGSVSECFFREGGWHEARLPLGLAKQLRSLVSLQREGADGSCVWSSSRRVCPDRTVQWASLCPAASPSSGRARCWCPVKLLVCSGTQPAVNTWMSGQLLPSVHKEENSLSSRMLSYFFSSVNWNVYLPNEKLFFCSWAST